MKQYPTQIVGTYRRTVYRFFRLPCSEKKIAAWYYGKLLQGAESRYPRCKSARLYNKLSRLRKRLGGSVNLFC